MEKLLIPEGGIIELRNVQLPSAKFIRLQPHHREFIDLGGGNPRVVYVEIVAAACCVRHDHMCLCLARACACA